MLSFPHSWQLLLSILSLLCVQVRAQFQNYSGIVSPPYSGAQILNIGDINNITVDDTTDFLSGGTITVDGIEFLVPRYAMVVTPNQNVMWSEMFIDGVPQLPLWPAETWEAEIFANEVNGTLIAGIIYIQQASARIITGFISSIDSATGQFFIAGNSNVPGSGLKSRLNDPVGRFGIAYPDNPLWAADTDFPSISAITGMPLCIQRPFALNATDDPLCPTKNRPIRDSDGQPHTMITFLPEAQRTASDPDPNFFVPMAVGDYVTVLGTFVDDGDGGRLFTIFNLIANLGIFTPPGELPNYITAVRNQFAVEGPALAEDGETRAVAFVTDVTTPVVWSSVNIDPCTGAWTYRPMLTEQPLANLPGQQPGKTVFRGGTDDFSPVTQFTAFNGTSGQKVTGNNITSGLNIAPVPLANGYIIAEVVDYGDQMFAIEFQDIPFLAQGSGPYVEGVPLKTPLENPPIIGQLDPWPGNTIPTPANCPPTVTTPVGSNGTATAVPTNPSEPIDEVSILNATFVRTRGETTYTVNAVDSVTTAPFPILTLTGADLNNPVGAIQMIDLGDGQYTLTISTQANLVSITITSSFGGIAVFTFGPG